MLNIVLFGAPGCGKGTQAGLMQEKYGLLHISTGEMIRKEIASQSAIGEELKALIERGELAPDSLVVEMIANYLREHRDAKGIIFDGFPRTTAQAEAFDKMLNELGESVGIMVDMEVPEEELVKRILMRGKESGRADDQSEDIIRNRIAVYNRQTAIVADYYRTQGKHRSVPSLGTIEEVSARIGAVIEALL